MSRSLSAQRATIRKLIAEQTEFALATPPIVFRQTEFPNGTMQPKPRVDRSSSRNRNSKIAVTQLAERARPGFPIRK